MNAGIFILIVIFALVIRFVAGFFDTDRIKEEIESKGGTLVSKDWAPFGKGWFGDKNDRIYLVIYIDKNGYKHEAYVKTSMFSGVYFTEDRIIDSINHSNPFLSSRNEGKDNLEIENESLKAEIEKLKQQISENDK